MNGWNWGGGAWAVLGVALWGCSLDTRSSDVLDASDEAAGAPLSAAAGSNGGRAGNAATTAGEGSRATESRSAGSVPLAPGDGGEAPGDGAPSDSTPAGTGAPGQGSGTPAPGLGQPGQSMSEPSSGTGAGSPGAAEPEVVGGCFSQLLENGAFDAGHAAWSEVSEIRDVVVDRNHPGLVAAGVTPHSGDYLAWIGGVPNGEYQGYRTTLQQVVPIPPEALSLTLTGYVWVSQTEFGRMPYDWAVLEFLDPEDTGEDYEDLWQIRTWNEESVTEGWTYFEALQTNVERLRGRSLPLVADARPSGNGTLSVWLDSLRLEARCSR